MKEIFSPTLSPLVNCKFKFTMNLPILIITLWSVPYFSTGSNPDSPRIVGGDEALQGEYPSMVYLTRYDDNGQFLDARGGTIVNENWILTAGHTCDDHPGVFVAVAGVQNSSHPESHWQSRTVVERHIHPEWYIDEVLVKYDICVMKLREPFDLGLTPYIEKANFTRDPILPGTPVTAYGWGWTSMDGPMSSVLLRANLSIVSPEECNVTWDGIIDESMICALNPVESTCAGDSGGPLVWNRPGSGKIQVGVVSFGSFDCASRTLPVIFAHVPNLLEWILQTTSEIQT